jgi:hypothetical protein
MTTDRAEHTSTLLENGMVLVAGGLENALSNATALSSADLFDPSAGTFKPTGVMTTSRANHTATLLGNGTVLITGGTDSNGNTLASAELYDPAAGTFTLAASMAAPRFWHTATLLGNGKVLIAGGIGGSGGNATLASAELYDPVAGTFTSTGSMTTGRYVQTSTLLNNGKVLITGGYNPTGGSGALQSAELYDPVSGTFSSAGSMTTVRYGHTATLLNNGAVLIAGGWNNIYNTPLASAEIYDPVAATFTSTGTMTTPRHEHRATLLSNGEVLITGGDTNSGATVSSAELYDPVAGAFTATSNMTTPREWHAATLLNDGEVLVTGGYNSSGTLPSAELYLASIIGPPGLVSIAVTPSSPTISPGSSQQFIATGTFTGGNTQELQSAFWTSSSPSVATVSNDATDHGAALALAAGSTTVTATAGAISGSTTLTVGSSSPTITSLSPPSVTVGAPVQTLTINGTNFLSSSTVTYNGTAHTAAFVSSEQLTISLTAADQATVGAFPVVVTNPAPGGASNSANFLVGSAAAASGSLVMFAVPANGGPPTGPWTLAVAAADSTGTGIPNLVVSLSATEGALSPALGLTDSTGTFVASIVPPSLYGGEAVAVSAAAGGRMTAVNIAFVSSSASGSSTASVRAPKRTSPKPLQSSSGTTLSVPFVMGNSGGSGGINPFSNPEICYSNAELSSTPTSACQTVYTENNIQQTTPNIGNAVCRASSAVAAASCLGTAAIAASCLSPESGIGVAICVGTAQYLVPLSGVCVYSVVDDLMTRFSADPSAAANFDEISFPQSATDPTAALGLACDSETVSGNGTGKSGTYVAVNPIEPSVVAGGTVQFTASVNNVTTTAVNWSVMGGAAGYGSITSGGLYTAPAIVPLGGYPVTVSVASVADSTAIAYAVVTILPKPSLSTITPNTAPAGSPDLNVALTGANFVSDSVVLFNGVQLPSTTFADANDLTTTIPAADLVNPGVFPITVRNPDTPGAVSNAVNFTVTSPSGGSVTVASLAFNPTSIAPGASTIGTVMLSGAAPSGGASVALTSSNTSVLPVPASVTIAAGSTSATFNAAASSSVSTSTQVQVSALYNSSSQSATVTVTGGSSGVAVTVSPSTAQVPINGAEQFKAIVTGTSNDTVTWTVNSVTGGNSTVGTITSTGLYTAPATVPIPATVTVMATSEADPSVAGSATVSVGSFIETVLHSFDGTTDVSQPVAPLIQASDSYMYGTTLSSIFSMDSAGNFSLLHMLSSSGSEGGNITGALVQGSDGYFYGTTGQEGTYGLGTAFKIGLCSRICG